MSQFDFPRIHFFGHSIIDPATGNNNYHFPLVTYEPLTARVVLPPRIYLDDHLTLNIPKLDKIIERLTYDQHGGSYIEIEPINTPELFKSWNITPLGSHAADGDFHKLYEVILTKNEQTPLKGKCPGHWNYFGTMNFFFENVNVSSIQLFIDDKVVTYTAENASSDFSGLLGAELSFTDGNGRNSAVMIDVSPTFSVYTQVFCDRIVLRKEGKIILDGQPSKASIRQINPNRVINDHSISGSSGTFYTTINYSQLREGRDAPIIKFFDNNGVTPDLLEGVFIRYDLFELSGIQAPDYSEIGASSNPAKSKVLGTISPWYNGEMISAPPGRLLVPNSEFLEKKKLGSMVSHYNPAKKLLSFDFIGCFPLIKNILNSTVETFEFGIVEICAASGLNKPESKIGTFNLAGGGYDRAEIINTGGLIDISVKEIPEEKLLQEHGELKLYLLSHNQSANSAPGRILVSKESRYRIVTDQIGIYCDENDPAQEGFFSNWKSKESCVIRVFENGKPLEGSIEVVVYELTLNPFSRGEQLTILENEYQLYDGKKFLPETSKAGHKYYVFYPKETGIFPLEIKNYMLTSGAFINLRILPSFNYDQYLGINQFGIREALDFDLIFKELLVHYDLIYPAAAKITPFEAAHLKKISGYVENLLSLDNWNRYLYMPSSRDLPKGKRDLIIKWLKNEIAIDNRR